MTQLTWKDGINKAMERRGLEVGEWHDRSSLRIEAEDEVLDILYNDDSGDDLIPELDSNSDNESDDEAYRTDIILVTSIDKIDFTPRFVVGWGETTTHLPAVPMDVDCQIIRWFKMECFPMESIDEVKDDMFFIVLAFIRRNNSRAQDCKSRNHRKKNNDVVVLSGAL
ncbi:hypothetical protein C0J52_25387 [Blattella germanica]|nr:hypothetical protein C0J52_25387 [Blattella germanica]